MLIENGAAMNMVHRRALGQAVDHLPRQFWALLDYCGMEGRICPAPEAWHRMWKLLQTRVTDRKLPQPPAPDEPRNSLKWALVDHLLWADQLGMFGEVDLYLRGLGPDQWAMAD
jgi:hypothetical protein